MSRSQHPYQDNTGHTSGSVINPVDPDSDLPPFQSFPAAPESRTRPNSGHAPPQQNPDVTSVAQGSSHRHQATDDRTAALPAFTPFPAASPGHRYAPPEGSRAQQAQPIPLPPYVPETGSSYFPGPPPPMRFGIQVDSPPGQPSPYAPPGPLTARPHVCEHCDSGFARAHDLKRHLETHKSERPHKCPNCQRSFSRKDAVQRHLVVTQCAGPSGSK
ncbi:hypothetical protein OPQ81_005955 [Rhizoctonia solani]|nr:hypothetical protein OPQ81_005955 [Rhizoctonia solani]